MALVPVFVVLAVVFTNLYSLWLYRTIPPFGHSTPYFDDLALALLTKRQ
ncbi:MAG: hypothetical protein KKE30_15685 [Gammaproteobacteria bacterium]|nr:hypothetical protein [Gammaproteobacteria bacterium]